MMQLREMYTGEKWKGEHIKELGRKKKKGERMKSFHKGTKDAQKKVAHKQKLGKERRGKLSKS